VIDCLYYIAQELNSFVVGEEIHQKFHQDSPGGDVEYDALQSIRALRNQNTNSHDWSVDPNHTTMT
jgi:hypothetical protein